MAMADQTLMGRAFQKLLEAQPDLAPGEAGGGLEGEGRERRSNKWKQEGVGDAKHQRHVIRCAAGAATAAAVAMNAFRFLGDMTHLFSVLVLLLKIYATKSCSGVSRKTQELYMLVFVARYLDLFTDYISLYNSVMKVVFITSSAAIVWCMRRHPQVRRTYDKEQDTFRHVVLVAAAFLLALIFNERFTFREICWAFSIYLEAVAILPQLVLLQRSRNVDNLTGQYVFFLGAYRAFYILNWIYRYFTEGHHSRWIQLLSTNGLSLSAWLAGLVQTALYADFFYYYFLSWKNNVKLELPA
ncbi:hypothetical protein C2845_PM06G00240 [Panicum miliaceum]|uniref:ER lumen protein-retaining receptor n=1 Tax=Panicum miliaceum TaxID=4540 RepID=A0A3L6RAU0_PANMI|nr:hypothetical protein C2845_PM06G00240 [Panicum miliaceum]